MTTDGQADRPEGRRRVSPSARTPPRGARPRSQTWSSVSLALSPARTTAETSLPKSTVTRPSAGLPAVEKLAAAAGVGATVTLRMTTAEPIAAQLASSKVLILKAGEGGGEVREKEKKKKRERRQNKKARRRRRRLQRTTEQKNKQQNKESR